MKMHFLKTPARFALLSATALIAMSAQAYAAGFYIQEQSVTGLGSAFSGAVTNLEDPSTIFFNPAGMTKLEGMQAQAGVHLLIPDSDVSDTGSTAPAGITTLGGSSDNPYDPTPVPNGFISYQISDSLWAGLGVTAPFGLGSEYDEDWFGRFDSTKTELKVIDIQPTLAYKINDMFSIGVGANIQHADADLRNRVVLGALTEGNSQLTGDDWGYGYSFGIQIKPMEAATIGLNYKSEVHQNLDGRIRVTTLAGATVGAVSSDGSAKLTTPDQATIGLAHKITERLTLQGQATWFGWNNFENITAIRASGAVASTVVQNYQTTWAYAVGAEYVANDAWTLRGGLQFDETPTTDEYRTSRTPDGDRTWASLGATYGWNDRLDIGMAATYIHIEDEEINIARGGGAGRMVADTEGYVGILALSATYKF
ncbi:MAG: OmpP1/FadL family transporter [Micavibrio sp.]